MASLNWLIFSNKPEEFSQELLKGISDRPEYCDEIMKKAFGKDYDHTSIMAIKFLPDLYEMAINNLLKKKLIIPVTKGQNVFLTSYKRA